MEILKKKRKVIRSQVTRFTNDADKILSSTSAIDLEEVSVLIERLRLAERQLKDADDAIEPHLREEDAEAEFETVLEYSDKVAAYVGRLEYRRKCAQKEPTTQETSAALGVGEESYEAMLYPVLLRALPRELVLNYHRARTEEGEKDGAATSDDDAASATSSPSGSSHQPTLRHLLRFFELELQSRERTQEDRPDEASDEENVAECRIEVF
ncbi:hypothetical protein HPB52_001913 [Rhipicephalus sanguineus]|uniref:Uncharacterized protein n=1 Tax=Rhipicephalus sanguineus TaxID=34632 RepID=A0A9D4PIH2_RHISA|nr:hypothetical protein HPB52_001913 [Rhipicephalus sanguineus]